MTKTGTVLFYSSVWSLSGHTVWMLLSHYCDLDCVIVDIRINLIYITLDLCSSSHFFKFYFWSCNTEHWGLEYLFLLAQSRPLHTLTPVMTCVHIIHTNPHWIRSYSLSHKYPLPLLSVQNAQQHTHYEKYSSGPVIQREAVGTRLNCSIDRCCGTWVYRPTLFQLAHRKQEITCKSIVISPAPWLEAGIHFVDQ